ncbi:MAG: ArdC-like ssDNA-binding domain-containing protein [Clostridia bacterium]
MEKDIDREKFKEKKRAELETLYDAVNEETLMIAEDPEKFSAYLRIQARFNRYTVTNAILLLHQFPDAQKLKTFEGWKREGASVGRGEKSISILEPYSYTKADGSMGKGFRIKKLFDISQTDVRMSPDPFLTGVSSRSLLRALLEASSVETEAADTLDHGKDAVYEQKKQKIYIRRMLEPDDFFRAAAVSIAEAQLAEQGVSCGQDELESKAKAIAFMLCVKYGIDPGSLRAKMPRATARMEIKEIKAELSEIRKTFTGIADRMDASISKQIREKRAGRERGHHEGR